MSRKIKFRAWDSQANKYEYWDAATNKCDGIFWYMVLRPEFKNGVEQFTGLKDKNGKEIYVGDILKTCTNRNCEIVFKDGGFAYKKNDKYGFVQYVHFGGHNRLSLVLDCEVVGNIHENSELLNV